MRMSWPFHSTMSSVIRFGRYFFHSTASKKLFLSTGTTCGAAPSAMSTEAFWPAEYSVASVLMMRAMSAPGRKFTRMLLPKYLFIAAWKRAAPWMPAKVEPLQLSVSEPSLLAAAASSFSAGLMPCATAVALETASSPATARPDTADTKWGTDSSLLSRLAAAFYASIDRDRYSCGTRLSPRLAIRVDAHAVVAFRCGAGDIAAVEIALDQIERAFRRRAVAAATAGLHRNQIAGL